MTLTPATMMTAIRSDFDAASALPAPAAAKLEALRDARDRAADLAEGLRGRASETFAELQDAQRQAGLLANIDPLRRFGPIPPNAVVRGLKPNRGDHPQIGVLEERAARLREKHGKLQAELKPLVARAAGLRDLVERVEKYVAIVAQTGATIALYDGTLPKVKADLAAVEKARAGLEILRIERERIEHAPRPIAEIRQRIEAEINEMAARSEPRLDEILEPHGTGHIEWPTAYHMGVDRNFPDGIGMVLWLAKDAAVDRLVELAEKRAGGEGLTAEERAAQLAEADATVLAAERTEEATIVACEAAGHTVERRKDADPRAILGLADSLPAPRGR